MNKGAKVFAGLLAAAAGVFGIVKITKGAKVVPGPFDNTQFTLMEAISGSQVGTRAWVANSSVASYLASGEWMVVSGTPVPSPTPVPTPVPVPVPVPAPNYEAEFNVAKLQLESANTREQLDNIWNNLSIWISPAAALYTQALINTYNSLYLSLAPVPTPTPTPVPVPIFDHRIVPPTYAPWVTAPDGTRYYQQVQSGEALDAWYAWVEAMGL